MIRLVIENLALFLLPTLMYLAYAYLSRDEDKKGSVIDDAPLIWLFVAGAVLVVVVLVAFGQNTGGKPTEGYTPPSFEDGKLKPGNIH
jgi:hypothetical protein